MKTPKIFAFTMIAAFAAFACIIYPSCKKESCSGVICENGGNCSKGNCSCPAGYSGSLCQNSSVFFQNNTFTPLNLSVNSSPTTIPVNGSIQYSGPAGSALTVTAYTYGLSSANTQQGDSVTWAYTDTLPSGGVGLTQPFNVPASYFYLQIINRDASQYIDSLYVNYHDSLQTADLVTIPNDRNIYGIGYYRSNTSTVLYAIGTSGGNWSEAPAIPDTANSTITWTIN